ncbi:hypothetical protein LOK49_LG05G01095 [Camellia lanceoleosa]|uniref:Uncharacterized protein n=1 Tax=Camellia lanceoleosa TaxID=1840588 RepID=A0ACC0HM49_9ERIC|nr:hypothetical protein LOK49_LG05G01095 [Camellia lanceoleosa]
MENVMVMDTEAVHEGLGDQTQASVDPLQPKTFEEALATVKYGDYTVDSSVEILSSDEEDDDQEVSSIVDPIGRVGGTWIVWDTNHVNVRASSVSPQVIHATIHKEDYEDWVLAAVCASPNPVLMKNLWDDLEDVAQNMDRPRVVVRLAANPFYAAEVVTPLPFHARDL